MEFLTLLLAYNFMTGSSGMYTD